MGGIGYSSAYKGEILRSSLKHPEKYADDKPIIYRSKLEFNFMMKFDLNPNILQWASEPISIPYMGNPLKETGRMSRYFPDFILKLKKGDSFINLLIEVKPSSELANAVNPAKMKPNSKGFWRFIQNERKWNSAIEFCKKQSADTGHEWQFLVITEKDIGKF